MKHVRQKKKLSLNSNITKSLRKMEQRKKHCIENIYMALHTLWSLAGHFLERLRSFFGPAFHLLYYIHIFSSSTIQFLTPSVVKSSSPSSCHLFLGLPLLLSSSGFHSVIVLGLLLVFISICLPVILFLLLLLYLVFHFLILRLFLHQFVSLTSSKMFLSPQARTTLYL